MTNDHDFTRERNPYQSPSTPLEQHNAILGQGEFPPDFSPFRSIWFSPRKTIRQIVTVNPAFHVVLLACLAGVGQALDRASTRNAGDSLPMTVIFGIAFVFGPLGGFLSLWIGAHLIRFSGRWIDGTGVIEHIKAALAWASVPSVVALLLWIPMILLFGSDMFTEATPTLDAQPGLLIPFLLLLCVDMALAFWGFILLCNTVAEVQGFGSAWMGFVNLILAALLIMVPLFGILFVVLFLSSQA